MPSLKNAHLMFRTSVRRPSCFPLLLAVMLVAGCEPEAPLSLSPAMSASTLEASASTLGGRAAFPVWHQGFNHDTDGWYGAATPGALGWCGTIERQTRHTGDHRPSAGRAYATVEGGPCNDFWSELGVPYGGPYAPGPELSLYSSVWPSGGYVTELDVYLDPTWSAGYSGTFAPGTLVEYGATIFPLEPEPGAFHTGPHYFVGVEAEENALSVLDQQITAAGWYTFRFVFGDDDGHIRTAFELRDRRGRLLVEEAIDPVQLIGPDKVPFEDELLASEWGSGHVWFFDIASGLQLPIDEHRVRQGR